MEILHTIHTLDLPDFRKKQILHAIFKEFKLSFTSMTNLPSDVRQSLDKDVLLSTLKAHNFTHSADKKTIKWSFLTARKKPIETVLMQHKDGRKTICISCQSGCPVNCSFCWTGAMGFHQNLSAWEIIEQLIIINAWLKENSERPVNHIVFMGMGEPMINLDAVTESIEHLIHPDFFGIGQRAITVSTSGYIPMMRKFWAAYPKVGLAVSLHAPNQKLRESLMPVAKQFKLDELIQECRAVQQSSKRRITYEYILIDKVNDEFIHAEELAALLQNQIAHVNLIPYNPIPNRPFQRPSRNRVMKFKQHLEDHGISATARVTMGDDIQAACGQLSGS